MVCPSSSNSEFEQTEILLEDQVLVGKLGGSSERKVLILMFLGEVVERT